MSVAERWRTVCAQVEAAAIRAKRSPDSIRVVAVSKRHPASAVDEAANAGVAIVGENYAQEMVAKMAEVRASDLEWHFIGRLQRNKAKLVVGAATLIHAVDSGRLLDGIAARARASGTVQDVLIAVSLAGESQKSGLEPDSVRELFEAPIPGGVRIRGLMTMPPLAPEPEASRKYFRALRELRDELEAATGNALDHLSMGTTGDFPVAIEEGATLVRIGTAIFGPRPA